MDWLCSDCGRDMRDHTIREVQRDVCKFVPPDPVAEPWTAECGLVNPEVLESSGERFSLEMFERAVAPTPLFERLMNEADEREGDR